MSQPIIGSYTVFILTSSNSTAGVHYVFFFISRADVFVLVYFVTNNNYGGFGQNDFSDQHTFIGPLSATLVNFIRLQIRDVNETFFASTRWFLYKPFFVSFHVILSQGTASDYLYKIGICACSTYLAGRKNNLLSLHYFGTIFITDHMPQNLYLRTCVHVWDQVSHPRSDHTVSQHISLHLYIYTTILYNVNVPNLTNPS